MPIVDILEKIKVSSGLSEAEIKQRIHKKMDELSGLISEQGAAHIVANELGVKVFEVPTGPLKISKILQGMKNIDADGRVVRVFPAREFKTESREGKVGNMLIGDETGSIRVVLWNDMADKLAMVKEGDIVRIKSAYVRENQGRKELHLGQRSGFALNPPGVNIGERIIKRKKINELKEEEMDVELLGTVVQVFNPNFYETCPQCRKRLDNGKCLQHGAVEPQQSCVLNILLDDGSGSLRVACFREQAETLVSGISGMKNNLEEFESAKAEVLGNIIKVTGNVRKNNISGNLDFTARTIDSSPNPDEEIKKISKTEIVE
jgi:replication factor A1